MLAVLMQLSELELTLWNSAYGFQDSCMLNVVSSTNTFFHMLYIDKLFIYTMYQEDVYVYFLMSIFLGSYDLEAICNSFMSPQRNQFVCMCCIYAYAFSA